MELRPYLIGIAGPSCSGKSQLASGLAAALENSIVLPLDNFYHDLSHLAPEEREKVNFDAPDAIEHQLFEFQLGQIVSGQAVQCPIYDFSSHTRCKETIHIRAGKYVIVEGLLSLYWPQARSLMDLKIFIEVPDALCLERRQRRDIAERGRTAESVLFQYRETVAPMYQSYCEPTCQYADLVLDGCLPPDQMVQIVLQHLFV